MKLESSYEKFIETKQYEECGKLLYKEILPYTTAILANPYVNMGWQVPDSEETLDAHGSASFLKQEDEIFLITNNHVVNFDMDGKPVKSTLYWPKWNDGEYHQIQKNFACHTRPRDVAISKISDVFNTGNFPQKKSINISKCAKFFNTHKNELFYVIGYPTKEPFQLLTKAQQLNCQVPDYNENCFVLNYSSLLSVMPDNISGISGSLVWDTKILECIEKGTDWTPSLAEVVGIIFALVNNNEAILCTKFEKMGLCSLFKHFDLNKFSVSQNTVID